MSDDKWYFDTIQVGDEYGDLLALGASWSWLTWSGACARTAETRLAGVLQGATRRWLGGARRGTSARGRLRYGQQRESGRNNGEQSW